jgi:hypothetical protein
MPDCGDYSARERDEERSAKRLAAVKCDIRSAGSARSPQDHEACARRQAEAVAASAFAADDQAFIDALAAPSER